MITQSDRTLSRGELEARSNQRARALGRLGLGRGDVVVLCLPNCIEYFETSFALWKLGATPLPVSPAAPETELRAIFDLVRPKAIIGDNSFSAGCTRIPGRLEVDPQLSTEPLPQKLPIHWRLSLTGGSTGRPKVIVDMSPPLFDPSQPILGQRVDGVQLNPGPLYHSGPFGLTHRGLFCGAHIVSMEKFDALEALRLLARYRVDWVFVVPTMMHRIWRLPEQERQAFDLTSLRTVLHTAASCPAWLKQGWITWLGAERIWEMYTSSESLARTMISGTEWLQRKGSVGRVQPGSELAVFDTGGRRCAPMEVGEVFFKPDAGINVKYLGAELTVVDGWATVGDLGYLDEDGYLYIVDRRTDMIISGGVNIYTSEVEGAIESHPDVECSVVIGLPDDDLGQRVHAIVQLAPSASAVAAEQDLRKFLRELLVHYKIPRTFEFVREPLKDSAGKVRRSALREERLGRGTWGVPSESRSG